MKTFTMLFIFWVCTSLFSQAFADLLVAPTRVSFEERDRTEQVVLINSGTVKRTYRLEWKEQTANEFGTYSPVTDTNFHSASSFIRFSPRQVTLNPGDRQVIKLMKRKTGDMPDGEYRSHLKFVILPQQSELENQNDAEGVSMKLHLFLSYTIPVIIKKGEARVNPTIDELSVSKDTNDKLELKVAMSKTTDYGAVGNIVAYFKDSSNNLTKLALLNSVNFFHEQTTRTVKLVPLQDLPQQPGSILIRYTGIQEFSGKTLAEREFPI
jgi:fimbrial chaperone protein